MKSGEERAGSLTIYRYHIVSITRSLRSGVIRIVPFQPEFDCTVVTSLMASRSADVYTIEDLLRCCTIQELLV